MAPGKRSISAVPAYRYLTDIEDEIDLAVIVFPANVCDRALEMCGKKGVKGVIMISAGFREVGPEGVKREQRIKDICHEYGISLIGPNCLGVINTDPKTMLNASFARKMPAEGRIAFLSQSGALCTAVLDYAQGKNIGFSKFVSFGNKAGVTEMGLLDYLHQDELTDVILLYLEELRDGRGLVETAKRITHGENAKPILAIKSGRTARGAEAASSHTGSLAGQDAICEAAVRRAYDTMLEGIAKLDSGAEVTGVIVRGMIAQGHELILGAKRDTVFGPTVMFGLVGFTWIYSKMSPLRSRRWARPSHHGWFEESRQLACCKAGGVNLAVADVRIRLTD